MTDERILERAGTVTESYDDFINSAHMYDTSTMWELANEGHIAGRVERRETETQIV